MALFRIFVARSETFAELEIEAPDADAARALIDDERLMAADWQVSDGNHISRSDVYIGAIDEIDD